jgi:hypothetical protein
MLLEYRCSKCKKEELCFDKEVEDRLPSVSEGCSHEWKALQPLAAVIHSTELFMRSMLDSIRSTKALCDKVTREAREQSELKQYLEMKKNL